MTAEAIVLLLLLPGGFLGLLLLAYLFVTRVLGIPDR